MRITLRPRFPGGAFFAASCRFCVLVMGGSIIRPYGPARFPPNAAASGAVTEGLP